MTTIKNILNVHLKLSILLIFSIAAILMTGCSKDEDKLVSPILDNNSMISSFVFLLSDNSIASNIVASIDEDNKTITAVMPPNTDITALLPSIKTAMKTQVSPDIPQDFSSPIAYSVIAEDGSEVVYTASVEVALSQRQILQAIMDANPGNTLDWDLQNTRDLGTLKGITTNAQGLISKMGLDGEGLSQLPPEMGQLSSLTELELEENQLTTFPSEISQLTNLTYLSLGSNHLTTIPAEIWQLTNLVELYLSRNQLTTIPSQIGQLTNLTHLSLHANQLINIPSQIGQLTKLVLLELDINQLTSIPSQIGQLTKLKKLYLDKNQLTTIPAEIGFLTNLNLLWIFDNQLTSIPQAICYLKIYNMPSMNFKKDIGLSCGITSQNDAVIGIYSSNPKNTLDWHAGSFPGVEFDKQRNVKKINIRNKGIERIPKIVSTLKLCELLDLRDNPLSFIDSKVCVLSSKSKVGLTILTDLGEGCN